MIPDIINTGKTVLDNPDLNNATLAYAKKIYPLLLKRCGNKDVALRVLAELLTDMYRAVQTTGLNDPLEAALYRKAEELQDDILGQYIGSEINNAIHSIAPQDELLPPAGDSPRSSDPTAPINRLPVSAAEESSAESAAEQFTYDDPTKDIFFTEENAVKREQQMPTDESLSAPKKILPESDHSAADNYTETVNRKKVSFMSILILVFLVFGIVSMVWIMVGLAMDYGFLPKLDLGYQWFSMNIAPWF